MSKGLIKKGNYAGWYSTSDEAFVPESQLTKVDLKNGEQSYVSTETGHPVEWMEEENYVFPLSHFQVLKGACSIIRRGKYLGL